MEIEHEILNASIELQFRFSFRLLFLLTIFNRDFGQEVTTEEKNERLLSFSELCHRVIPSIEDLVDGGTEGAYGIRFLIDYCRRWRCEGLCTCAWRQISCGGKEVPP